jgi:hypothetical protein
MVDAVNGIFSGRQSPEKAPVVVGAGYNKLRQFDLFLELTRIGGVNVLGVGGETESKSAEFIGK